MAISTAVDLSAVARVVGIQTIFRDLRGGATVFLPQRVAVVGQGNTAATYATTKAQVFSALEVAQTYGFGSPLHLAVLQLLPTNGDGVGTIPVTVYPLEDDVAGVAAAGDITPTGTATAAASLIARINNIDAPFNIAVGDAVADVVAAIVAAVNAVLEMPVVAADGATKVDVTSKWKGTSANDIYLEIVGTNNITFAFTQPTGGATNPAISTATDQFGTVWESMVLNCLDIGDSTAIAAWSTFGEGRWGSLVKKPLVVFTGNPATTVANAITVPDARKTDRVNCQLVSPGSKDLPFVTAARQLARIVKQANNNPPVDYGSLQATGLTPGVDGDQWSYLEKDTAIKGGSSTVDVKDGVVNLSDTVTFYHPSGDPTPAYRYVVDIVKVQNIIFNLNLIFENAEWDGAPLIPDDQPTTNKAARKPKHAKAAVNTMIDNLALDAILSDPATAKANTQVGISTSNPKRLDVALTVQLSGNANIISIDLNFGFYFGTVEEVA
jgi:phage tail sheath gpL-like